ncbi:hypothetical protein D3C72_1364500 [compost metagenome]
MLKLYHSKERKAIPVRRKTLGWLTPDACLKYARALREVALATAVISGAVLLLHIAWGVPPLVFMAWVLELLPAIGGLLP